MENLNEINNIKELGSFKTLCFDSNIFKIIQSKIFEKDGYWRIGHRKTVENVNKIYGISYDNPSGGMGYWGNAVKHKSRINFYHTIFNSTPWTGNKEIKLHDLLIYLGVIPSKEKKILIYNKSYEYIEELLLSKPIPNTYLEVNVELFNEEHLYYIKVEDFNELSTEDIELKILLIDTKGNIIKDNIKISEDEYGKNYGLLDIVGNNVNSISFITEDVYNNTIEQLNKFKNK